MEEDANDHAATPEEEVSSPSVVKQPKAGVASKPNPGLNRRPIRSGMTPRANDMCLNPLQRSSSHQNLIGGRRGGGGSGRARAVRGPAGGAGSLKSQGNPRQPVRHALKADDPGPRDAPSAPPLRQPIALSPASRRWRSADRLNLVVSDVQKVGGHETEASATNTNRHSGTLLHQSTEHVHSSESTSDSSPSPSEHLLQSPRRSRLQSDPVFLPLEHSLVSSNAHVIHQLASPTTHSEHRNKAGDSTVMETNSQNPTETAQCQQVIDSIEIAHQLVQSSIDNQQDSLPDVFHKPGSPLPMSLGCHPFVFPSEDVPAPLTLNLVQDVSLGGETPTRSTEVTSLGDHTETKNIAELSPSLLPPSDVLNAWQLDSSSSADTTSSTSAVPASPRRHSANIELRALTLQMKPRPLPKSKSSWRLQAARARESVANLLSFARPKEKEKNAGLEHRRSSLQYLSAPDLEGRQSENTADIISPPLSARSVGHHWSDGPARAGQLSRSKNGHWSNPELEMSPQFAELKTDRSDKQQEMGSNDLDLQAVVQNSNLSDDLKSVNKVANGENVDEEENISSPSDPLTSSFSDFVSKNNPIGQPECLVRESGEHERSGSGHPRNRVSPRHHQRLINKRTINKLRRTSRHKSTPDLSSVHDITSSSYDVQEHQELSKSHDDLVTATIRQSSESTDLEDGQYVKNENATTEDMARVFQSSHGEHFGYSSTSNSETGVKADENYNSTWLSPSLQLTLKAAREHLLARGLQRPASIPSTETSSHQEETINQEINSQSLSHENWQGNNSQSNIYEDNVTIAIRQNDVTSGVGSPGDYVANDDTIGQARSSITSQVLEDGRRIADGEECILGRNMTSTSSSEHLQNVTSQSNEPGLIDTVDPVFPKSQAMENLDVPASGEDTKPTDHICCVSPTLERSDSVSSLTSESSVISAWSEARGVRESSRRVENLLSNQLFQKHLIRHAEAIERNVFRMHRRGIRKSISHFDLSPAQAMQDSHLIGHNVFNHGDINNNNNNNNDGQLRETIRKWTSDDDKYKNSLSRSISMSERHSPSSISSDMTDTSDDGKENIRPGHMRQLRKAATTLSLRTPASPDFVSELVAPEAASSECEQTRRRALSCGESPAERNSLGSAGIDDKHDVSQRHRRMHIPSFREFRQQRCQSEMTFRPSDVTLANDIYVIQEVENDDTTGKVRDEANTIVANTEKSVRPTVVSFASEYENKKLVSIDISTKSGSRKNVTSPVFSHPAIVVTSADLTDKLPGVNKRLMLNRSKSESNMKRNKSKSPPPRPTTLGEKIYSPLLSVQYSVSTECLLSPSGEGTFDDISSKSLSSPREQHSEESISGSVPNLFTGKNIINAATQLETSSASQTSGHNDLKMTIDEVSGRNNGFHAKTTKNANENTKNQMAENTDFSSENEDDLDPDVISKRMVQNRHEKSPFGRYTHDSRRQSMSTDEDDFESAQRDFPDASLGIPFQGKSSQHFLESLGFDWQSVSGSANHEDRREDESPVSIEGSEVEGAMCQSDVANDVVSRSDDMTDDDVSCQRRSPTSSSSDSDQSTKTAVLRSTSDVSAAGTDEREKRRRERKDRPYKSDPFTGTKKLPHHSLHPDSSLYKGSSVSTSCSFPSLEELAEYSDSASCVGDEDEEDEEARKRRHRLSSISTASEDSGVVGHSRPEAECGVEDKVAPPCSQCASYSKDTPQANLVHIPHSVSDSALCSVSACKKCLMRVRERKETIQELAETEKRYGRDLHVLKEEFYRPMKETSLLTLDQLDTIFINLEELIHVHKQFMSKLTSALITAVKAGDEDLAAVNVGNIFSQTSTMFLAFENYCINQARAACLLEQLEKEKELLRVFLEVAQNQNPKLRRMPLKSFLMMPVQRIMRYPLLLGRLYKVTPVQHEDKESIKQAQQNIENILQHINAKTHTASGVRAKGLDVHGYSLSDKIEVNRVALEVLGWNKKDVCDVLTSRLWYGQVPDPTWASKRARNVKFNMVHAVLLTHGRPVDTPTQTYVPTRTETPSVMQVAMVLVREKGGRYQVVRDPLLLDRCVVTVDPEYDHVFEIHEQGKDTYLFKAEHGKETRIWIGHLKHLSRNLGYWRRRRNGLANIMLRPS